MWSTNHGRQCDILGRQTNEQNPDAVQINYSGLVTKLSMIQGLLHNTQLYKFSAQGHPREDNQESCARQQSRARKLGSGHEVLLMIQLLIHGIPLVYQNQDVVGQVAWFQYMMLHTQVLLKSILKPIFSRVFMEGLLSASGRTLTFRSYYERMGWQPKVSGKAMVIRVNCLCGVLY